MHALSPTASFTSYTNHTTNHQSYNKSVGIVSTNSTHKSSLIDPMAHINSNHLLIKAQQNLTVSVMENSFPIFLYQMILFEEFESVSSKWYATLGVNTTAPFTGVKLSHNAIRFLYDTTTQRNSVSESDREESSSSSWYTFEPDEQFSIRFKNGEPEKYRIQTILYTFTTKQSQEVLSMLSLYEKSKVLNERESKYIYRSLKVYDIVIEEQCDLNKILEETLNLINNCHISSNKYENLLSGFVRLYLVDKKELIHIDLINIIYEFTMCIISENDWKHTKKKHMQQESVQQFKMYFIYIKT